MGMAIFGAATALISVLFGFTMGFLVGKNSSESGSVTYLSPMTDFHWTGKGEKE